MQIAIAEAKAQFAELIRRAESGEAIELTRYGRPVARLLAAERPAAGPLIGAMAGQFEVPDMAETDARIAALFTGDVPGQVRVLLDTHVLLWALIDDPALRDSHRAAIGSGELHVSAASVWEIGIKRALGKLDVPENLFDVALRAGCRPLPITWAHADAAAALPAHHADPFDRMLIAQAIAENLVLLSADKMFSRYPVEVLT